MPFSGMSELRIKEEGVVKIIMFRTFLITPFNDNKDDFLFLLFHPIASDWQHMTLSVYSALP